MFDLYELLYKYQSSLIDIFILFYFIKKYIDVLKL